MNENVCGWIIFSVFVIFGLVYCINSIVEWYKEAKEYDVMIKQFVKENKCNKNECYCVRCSDLRKFKFFDLSVYRRKGIKKILCNKCKNVMIKEMGKKLMNRDLKKDFDDFNKMLRKIK